MRTKKMRILIAFAVFVLLIQTLSACNSLSQTIKDNESSQFMKADGDEEEKVSGSKPINPYDNYLDHGEPSCGLTWVTQSNWNDEMDEYQTEFMYIDNKGSQKSSWFSYDDYYPKDFRYGFVIISEKYHDFSSRYLKNFIYDTEFNLIGKIITRDTHGTDHVNITDFEEHGYAFAEGKVDEGKPDEEELSGFLWIDKDGVHQFEDNHSPIYDVAEVEVTNNYFILNNWCIYNHSGELLVDMYEILGNDKDLGENYLFGKLKSSPGKDSYSKINIVELVDNEYIKIEFETKNKQSKNIVWFDCIMDFNGNYIQKPTKQAH